jgi:hypothetical protein
MLGWLRADAARASRRKRSRARIVSNVFGQEFQSHESAQAGVLGFVDNPHPAATQLFDDAVVRDALADQEERLRPSGGNLRVDEQASQRPTHAQSYNRLLKGRAFRHTKRSEFKNGVAIMTAHAVKLKVIAGIPKLHFMPTLTRKRLSFELLLFIRSTIICHSAYH